MNQAFSRLVIGVFKIGPGIPIHDIIGLPFAGRGGGHPPAFQINDPGPCGEILILVGHHHFAALRLRLVVIVGQKLQSRRLVNDHGPAVKVNEVGMITVNHFDDFVVPLPAKLRVRPWLGVQIIKGRDRQRFAVKAGIGRFKHVGVRNGGAVPSPLPLMVEGGEEFHFPPADGSRQLADKILFWSHPRGVPRVHLAVPK